MPTPPASLPAITTRRGCSTSSTSSPAPIVLPGSERAGSLPSVWRAGDARWTQAAEFDAASAKRTCERFDFLNVKLIQGADGWSQFVPIYGLSRCTNFANSGELARLLMEPA